MSNWSNINQALQEGEGGRRYTIYLVIVALAGWSLASYDLNLLVLTIPDISAELGLSATLVGSIGFFVFGAQFVVTLFVGYGMDTIGPSGCGCCASRQRRFSQDSRFSCRLSGSF